MGITGHWLRRLRAKRDGVALVIVLAFIVLLTGLIVAFFSRSLLDRQISDSSVSRARVSAFADGATDTIIGELKQEIALSSSATTITTGTVTTTIYTPLNPAGMLPQISGTTGITTTGTLYPYNLLKVSTPGQLFYSGTSVTGATVTIPSSGSNNVSSVSTTTPSINGRFLTQAYWNQHYLLPMASGSDATPAPGAFVAPSWILVARDGSNPTSSTLTSSMTASGADPVVGRYAFAIYHEGGLLDVNAAGYPHTSGTGAGGTYLSAHKNSLAYADLTQLPGGLTSAQIDELVAWRNYASIAVSGGSFISPNFTLLSADNYDTLVVSNSTGYLGISGTAVDSQAGTYQTDRMFASRQELIKFVQDALGVTGANLNVLNYLTTFTRDVNQPSYVSAVQLSGSAPAPVVLNPNLGGNSAYQGDKLINPNFPAVRVQASFTRNDGSTANVGDPLVSKRFALQRLAWITYKGPSASRTQTDPDIVALINDGIPWSYLQLGTAQNIENYFGLNWDKVNNRWLYNVHNGGGTGSGIIMLVGRPLGTAASASKYVEDAGRDPDFFELLKAGITVGSLGKAGVNSATAIAAQTSTGYSASEIPGNLRYNIDTSVDYHVIQIGANILSEVNPTSYPVRIAFNDGSSRGNWEFQGVTDLPYLSYVFNGVLRTQAPAPAAPATYADSSPFQYPVASTTALTNTGNAYMVQVPAVWNPYDPNGTPGVLRPSQFRILIDSNDPVSLSGSYPDIQIWHGAEGATSPTANSDGGSNQGLSINNAAYSWLVTGKGATSEKPGNGSGVSGVGSIVQDGVLFNDSNGTLFREPTAIFSTAASAGGATRVNALATNSVGNITGIDANPLPSESDGSTGPWAPLVLGKFPLAFVSGSNTYYTGVGLIGSVLGSGVDDRVYFTYRLQYPDPISNPSATAAGNWDTYDTKYGRTTDGMFSFQEKTTYSPSVITGPNSYNTYSWASAIDPRTARFGLISDTMNGGRSRSVAMAPAALGWIDNSSGALTVGVTYPIRQDNSQGFYFVNLDQNNLPAGGQSGGNGFALLSQWSSPTQDIPYPSFAAGWTQSEITVSPHGSSDLWMFAPGLYAQNNPSAPFYQGAQGSVPTIIEPSYYADADGVVRRAAGAYVPFGSGESASSTVGLPPDSIQGYAGAPQTTASTTPSTTTPFTQSQSRPLLLHRPFRTVGELGYVFRDLPWKNLDFFTPESGDAGLLDLFSINETNTPNSVIAGKVNLNTRQAPVLAAIVSGAYIDDPKLSNATVGSLSSSVASTIAASLTARTFDPMYGHLQNLSELVGKWNAAAAATGTLAYSPTAPTANGGVDLPRSGGYMDGKLSYIGFSGAASASTGTPENLTDAYGNANYSSPSLKTGLTQIQRFREAPIRALANAGQTRVWNLLIDVVAQTGRYPQFTSSPGQFVVEGQQHYWVHVAIDRLTGQILDKQIEQVTE